jgi:hypothetical protein
MAKPPRRLFVNFVGPIEEPLVSLIEENYQSLNKGTVGVWLKVVLAGLSIIGKDHMMVLNFFIFSLTMLKC